MRREDFRRFGLALSACAELYGRTVSEGAMSLWWQALERFDIEAVENAFRQAVESPDSGQFMPKPADLIRRLEGTSSDRSLVAWGKVLDAMQRVGAYRSVVFDDGSIHAAISDMGGWPAVCRTLIDELPFTQKRFCDLHRAYSLRPDTAYPAQLLGEHALENRLKGHAADAPALVGSPDRAREVERLGSEGSKTPIALADALPSLRRIGAAA
ncbi:MAG TPA: DUF6475 domain-containing protein [Rubrivivax sp.]|nr:DUF6475 domain-containing protein [Rubrivivax sp.]